MSNELIIKILKNAINDSETRKKSIQYDIDSLTKEINEKTQNISHLTNMLMKEIELQDTIGKYIKQLN